MKAGCPTKRGCSGVNIMPKLLSDEELERKIDDLLDDFGHDVVSKAGASRRAMKSKYRRQIIPLIKQQKLLHGDMVIGEDEVVVTYDHRETVQQRNKMRNIRNKLRAEQRARNSL